MYKYTLIFIVGCSTVPSRDNSLTDDEWLDSIVLDSAPVVHYVKHASKRKRKHSSSWMDFIDLGDPVITVKPKLDLDKVYLVNGALTKHFGGKKKKRDEVNPLLGLESGSVQCGGYDNSRTKPSRSYYCTSKWYKRQVGLLDAEFNSKIGLSYYDSKGSYKDSVRPLATIGIRKNTSATTWIDIDYGAGSLLGQSNIVALTWGKLL
jgi:hypothetical protein